MEINDNDSKSSGPIKNLDLSQDINEDLQIQDILGDD